MSSGAHADAKEPSRPQWSAGSIGSTGRGRLLCLLGRQPGSPPPMLAAMIVLPLIAATVLGSLVVFAEVNALVVCVSLLASVFIMLEFRLGVVCLIVLMPLSESTLFPHNLAGITGLNPLNLLLLATLVSFLLRGSTTDRRAIFAARPPLWPIVVPFLIAGILGSLHVGEIPAELVSAEPGAFGSLAGYMVDIVLKPMMFLLFAMLVGAAAIRSRRPERFVLPMLISTWVMSLLVIGFVLLSGTSLAELASSQSRTFFSPLGVHPNELGRLFAIAYALMLYTCAASKDASLRLVLIGSMALVVVALTLTFSRGSFFGFAVVNVLFLLSRRKVNTVLLGGILLVGMAFLLPGAVFDRIQSGWGGGANAISAGRVDEIWLPLLPELWRSPIIGNGLASIAWSDAMHAGTILAVGHPHNAYLAAMLDMGLAGLLLFCNYFFQVWKGFRRLSTDPALDPALRGFYAGAAAGLVSFLLAGFTGSSLAPVAEQFYLWLAIGMMYGQRRTATETPAC
jgi:O-antigen ligase